MRHNYGNRPQSDGRARCEHCGEPMLGVSEHNPVGLGLKFCDCPDAMTPDQEARTCDGCGKTWPDYKSWYNHNCPQSAREAAEAYALSLQPFTGSRSVRGAVAHAAFLAGYQAGRAQALEEAAKIAQSWGYTFDDKSPHQPWAREANNALRTQNKAIAQAIRAAARPHRPPLF